MFGSRLGLNHQVLDVFSIVPQGDSTSLLATTCNNLGCYYKKVLVKLFPTWAGWAPYWMYVGFRITMMKISHVFLGHLEVENVPGLGDRTTGY